MISIESVTKRWRGASQPAVDSVTLDVPRGRIFGLLGHNGAGKSTLIGMVLGQVFPDAGRVTIGGYDVFRQRRAALARVGAIFETPAFYGYLSGERNLRIFCEFTARPDERRLREVVKFVGLEKRIGECVRAYSHGMRQRLALAQALLPNPELLILDEPSEGLDPEGIHDIRNLILRLNREWGLTILFSSHLLSEVQQLCTHLAVMRMGKVVFDGEWRQFVKRKNLVRLRVDRQMEAQQALTAEGWMTFSDGQGTGQLLNGRCVADVAEWLVQKGFRIHAIAPVEQTLEDVYLEITRG
jgi:ABC-2 type transport system ATP-binding protein